MPNEDLTQNNRSGLKMRLKLTELIENRLIAYQHPLYQVLALDVKTETQQHIAEIKTLKQSHSWLRNCSSNVVLGK